MALSQADTLACLAAEHLLLDLGLLCGDEVEDDEIGDTDSSLQSPARPRQRRRRGCT
jgi:hypothetical protein